jgi:N-acetylmuramic acid 6-phosphate (MurNAc-6-P) etherase
MCENLSNLKTEEINDTCNNLHQLSTFELMQTINEADKTGELLFITVL